MKDLRGIDRPRHHGDVSRRDSARCTAHPVLLVRGGSSVEDSLGRLHSTVGEVRAEHPNLTACRGVGHPLVGGIHRTELLVDKEQGARILRRPDLAAPAEKVMLAAVRRALLHPGANEPLELGAVLELARVRARRDAVACLLLSCTEVLADERIQVLKVELLQGSGGTHDCGVIPVLVGGVCVSDAVKQEAGE